MRVNDVGNGVGGIHNQVKHHLVDFVWQAWHKGEGRVQVQRHLGDVLPLVAGHSNGTLDGPVEVDGDLVPRPRMGKIFHGMHDLGDALDPFERLLNGLRNFLDKKPDIEVSSGGLYLAQERWRERPCPGSL